MTPTPTQTDTATPTHTATPLPPGVLVGEVFDDDNALALPGVTARSSLARMGEGQGEGDSATTTDQNGRYVLTADVGEQWIELTRDGYTRAIRRVAAASKQTAVVQDARLTKLSDPTTVGPNGLTLMVPYALPGQDTAALVALEIPAGTLEGTSLGLTVLSPQGLIHPVPRGWSVLLGVNLQTPDTSAHPEPVEGPTPNQPWATLRVPADLLFPAASMEVVAAVFDEESIQWRGGPVVTQTADAIEIPVSNSAFPTPHSAFQLALLIADTLDLIVPPGDPLPATNSEKERKRKGRPKKERTPMISEVGAKAREGSSCTGMMGSGCSTAVCPQKGWRHPPVQSGWGILPLEE